MIKEMLPIKANFSINQKSEAQTKKQNQPPKVFESY
jgi:hypothetical protein